jgi:cytoskeletal protein CcmA (bactofilin family)
MFNKQAKPTEGPVMRPEPTTVPALDATPQARKSPKMASLIANDITIEGNVMGDGELHVDGVIRGDVRVPRLSVGESGHIEGSVQAEAVEARGRIVGSITAKQVKLLGTSYIDGDITHEQLTMETGAFFQGRSLKFQRQPAPVAAPTATTNGATVTQVAQPSSAPAAPAATPINGAATGLAASH